MGDYDKLAALERGIDKALTPICEDGDLGCYVTDTLMRRMAEAAFAVLRSAIDNEEWLKQQGYMND